MPSPWLVNVFMVRILREVKERLQGGVQLAQLVQILLFAADTVVCTYKEKDTERNVAEMKVAMEKWGMSVHCGKTKVMTM